MRVCVPLRDPASGNLRGGNLRSEPRWERLALEACISNPEVTEVYTAGYEWDGGQEMTAKYRGQLSNKSPTDCILLMQDWNSSTANCHPFKAIIVNIFHGPWKGQEEEIQALLEKVGGHLYFVIGHPALFEQELSGAACLKGGESYGGGTRVVHSHLGNFVSMDHVLFLPLPWIPGSQWGDRFDNRDLLYSWRSVFFRQIFDSKTVLWALQAMTDDPNLRLRILTGWGQEEVKDYVANEVVWIHEDVNDYFWRAECVQPYISLRDRVQLFYGLDWSKVLEECASAKLLITHAKHYGGPSMEAAMHGVPFVGTGDTFGALAACPGYVHTHDEEEACKILQRMLTDREYYTSVARRYHDYAVGMYSFDSFNTGINRILAERGLL